MWLHFAPIPRETEDEALLYAIHNQRDRRNLTDGEILGCIQLLDRRKKTGPKDNSAQSCAKPQRSSETTGETLGTSPRKVERARSVLDYADEETKEKRNKRIFDK
jgi:hypothetical protein